MLQDKHHQPVAVGRDHRSPPAVAGVVVERKKAPELAPGIAVVAAAAVAGDLETRPVHHTAMVPASDKRRVVARGCPERKEPVVPRDRPRWDLRSKPTHRCFRTGRSPVRVHRFPEEPMPCH